VKVLKRGKSRGALILKETEGTMSRGGWRETLRITNKRIIYEQYISGA
jgi:hypothetical protein